jgi:hypothetical protein
VNLSQVRIHDLKHTFGRRLHAAGVSYEDRQDLLGHKSGRITTHYSAAELHNLIAAANKVCDRSRQGPILTLLRINCEVGNEGTQKTEIRTPDHLVRSQILYPAELWAHGLIRDYVLLLLWGQGPKVFKISNTL